MKEKIVIVHVEEELPADSGRDQIWAKARKVEIASYWSGKKAPRGRHLTAGLLWSDTALYVRFEANQTEPLVVSERPDLKKKTKGLWDRDVCEIFIAPDNENRTRYFEFEIAPTGEWIDVGIKFYQDKRQTDWDYRSGMTSAAAIQGEKVIMTIKIPFSALGRTPKAGDIWLGNLFRCVGKDPTRGYLAWRPTRTKTPNFHVPAKFGEFEFVKN